MQTLQDDRNYMFLFKIKQLSMLILLIFYACKLVPFVSYRPQRLLDLFIYLFFVWSPVIIFGLITLNYFHVITCN